MHIHNNVFCKSYIIPGTKPDARPAGFPPPNHFLVALKIERWRPLRETICKHTQNNQCLMSDSSLSYVKTKCKTSEKNQKQNLAAQLQQRLVMTEMRCCKQVPCTCKQITLITT